MPDQLSATSEFSPTKAGTFGNSRPLKPHKSRKAGAYSTPAPGAYDAVDIAKSTTRFSRAPKSSFGGPLAKIDRPSTGYLAGSLRFRAPGPGNYDHDSSVDKQAESRRATAERTRFAKADRSAGQKVYMPGSKQLGSALHNPSPNAYEVSGGQDMISRGKKKNRAPATSFGGNLGKMKRPSMSLRTGAPPQCGPGTYTAKQAGIGTQVSSSKRTAPRAKFGTQDRVKGQMALAPGYKAPSTSGALNPGPGAYAHRSAVGVQSDAKKPSVARYSFGKEPRGVSRAGKVPGPGAYNSSATMGAQVNSRYRTGARTQFGTAPRASMANNVG